MCWQLHLTGKCLSGFMPKIIKNKPKSCFFSPLSYCVGSLHVPPLSETGVTKLSSLAFSLTFSIKQADVFFFPLFIECLCVCVCVCPSAPVLKINHHTANHAHDFNMSSKGKERAREKAERCKTLCWRMLTLLNTFLFYCRLLCLFSWPLVK